MANRVFEDRLGCWLVPDSNGRVTPKLARLPALRGLGVADIFLPREATPADFSATRAAGFGAHLYEGADPDITAAQYAARFLSDFAALGSKGGGELNIELRSDPPLKGYLRRVVTLIRNVKPNLPLRLNIAPAKAFALPIDLLQSDANLYACEQGFYGDMSRYEDPLYDLLSWGVPLAKATVCYGGAALLPSSTIIPDGPTERFVGLGTLWTWSNGQRVGQLTRGVIFQDDLLAEVGLL